MLHVQSLDRSHPVELAMQATSETPHGLLSGAPRGKHQLMYGMFAMLSERVRNIKLLSFFLFERRGGHILTGRNAKQELSKVAGLQKKADEVKGIMLDNIDQASSLLCVSCTVMWQLHSPPPLLVLPRVQKGMLGQQRMFILLQCLRWSGCAGDSKG